jgi:hypothetical protein
MRSCTGAVLVGLLLALAPGRAGAGAKDAAATVAVQKKAGAAAWQAVEAGAVAFHETKHLLIYAPKGMEKRLKAAGVVLEGYHDRAAKALAFDGKGPEAYPGKVTVYLFGAADHLTTFARRVEKRRPMPGETGSFSAEDERLHAAGAAGGKGISVEARAGEQLAALLLTRKAGLRTPLPDWLVGGFGRATSYRVLPREKFVLNDRRQARALAAKRQPADVWGGGLDATEADALQGSLADFLAYGPGAGRFAKFVAGFAPGEGMTSKTTVQAMESAGIKVANVEKLWKPWAYNPR